MSGVNSLARNVATKTIFVDVSDKVDSTVSFNQGDLLIFDTTSKLLALPAAEADAATFLGVAPVTIVSGKYPSIYNTAVDASTGTPALPGPQYGSVYRVILTAGEAVVSGQEIYLDPVAGPRNVQSAGTKAIGIYEGKALTAGTGGTEIEVLIGARYSNDTLKF